MIIQNMPIEQNNTCNFKSVYPVYHWRKVSTGYAPELNMEIAKKYQNKFLRLIAKIVPSLIVKPKNFAQAVVQEIAEKDTDYLNTLFIRTYYTKGGLKEVWNGNVYDIKPCAYILTGHDAVDYEQMYGRPYGYAKSEVKNNPGDDTRFEFNKAKDRYSMDRWGFIKERLGRLKDKETGMPLELHMIFKREKGQNSEKLVKVKFFGSGAKDNPLITNHIL